jgi:hypothetical protein
VSRSSAPVRVVFVCLLALFASRASAQERAYFSTYDHYLEEAGDLEVAVAATTGVPKHDQSAYTAPWLELEYGVTGWWTSELYVEGVTTRRDGAGFTGWRWENRFRPLTSEHAVNPVLYVEYERINEASRIQKEIVGAGAIEYEPIAELREHTAHELEAKLVLSSSVRSWNISENATFEKNLSEAEGVEFGYSVGVSRSLASLASGAACRLCRENLVLGAEAYGGLGSSVATGLAETRHYLGPVMAWRVNARTTLKASPAFGLTEASDRYLIRFGIAYEFSTR